MSQGTDVIKLPYVDIFWNWRVDTWGFIILLLFALVSNVNALQ